MTKTMASIVQQLMGSIDGNVLRPPRRFVFLVTKADRTAAAELQALGVVEVCNGKVMRPAALRASQPPEQAGMVDAERRGEKRAIARLAAVASGIGWQAGVGARETAGAIVSYLATSPDEIAPFVAGDLSPLDFAGDWMSGGCLTWQTADGKVWSPEEAKAAREAKTAAQAGTEK